MKIIPVSAFHDNYIWIITDESVGVFDCVDPGDASPVIEYAQKNRLKLRAVLLTHHHNDHIGGVHELTRAWPQCLVYGSEDSRIPYLTHPVKEHEVITVGKNHLQILSIPGHTSTHISYYEQQQGWLFCGDTLFSAGCGRVFDGTMEELHTSLQMIKKLPEITSIFCGHEYTLANLKFARTVEPKNAVIENHIKTLEKQPASCSLPSTLELELKINPFLRTDSEDVKKYALKHGALSPDSLEVFRTLRNQKDLFKS